MSTQHTNLLSWLDRKMLRSGRIGIENKAFSPAVHFILFAAFNFIYEALFFSWFEVLRYANACIGSLQIYTL